MSGILLPAFDIEMIACGSFIPHRWNVMLHGIEMLIKATSLEFFNILLDFLREMLLLHKKLQSSVINISYPIVSYCYRYQIYHFRCL